MTKECYLYVGNLPYNADEAMVRALFPSTFTVEEVRIAISPEVGRFMGYAFVKLGSKEEVARAIKECQGKELDDRATFLDLKANQEDLWQRAFGGQ